MESKIYEIYVDGVFQEAWENNQDAITRALNIEDELFDGHTSRVQIRSSILKDEL